MAFSIISAPTSANLQVNGNTVLTLLATVPNYTDDVAAAAGGVPINGIYRTGSVLKVRVA